MDFDEFQDAVLFVMGHDEDYNGYRFGIADVEKIQGQSYTGLAAPCATAFGIIPERGVLHFLFEAVKAKKISSHCDIIRAVHLY